MQLFLAVPGQSPWMSPRAEYLSGRVGTSRDLGKCWSKWLLCLRGYGDGEGEVEVHFPYSAEASACHLPVCRQIPPKRAVHEDLPTHNLFLRCAAPR